MHCNRAWSAWGYGTMTENDFSPVSDDDEAVMEIVEAILTAALPALERSIREQVAYEIQSMPCVTYTMPNGRSVKVVRRDDAARIARGKDHA